METEIRKELNRVSLILKAEAENRSYETRMFLACHVRGLLPCGLRHVNNESVYSYDITGRQTLESLCETKELGLPDLKWILNGILKVPAEMEEYLLSADRLSLEPNMIFLNSAEKKVELVFLPFDGRDFAVSLRQMTEFLLTRLDRADGEAVMFGYRFFRLVMEREMQPERLLEFLSSGGKGQKAAVTYADSALFSENEKEDGEAYGEVCGEDYREEYGEDYGDEGPFGPEEPTEAYVQRKSARSHGSGGWRAKMKLDRRTLLLIGGGLVCAILLYTVIHSGIFEEIDISVLLGAGLAAVSVGALIGYRVVKKWKWEGKKEGKRQMSANICSNAHTSQEGRKML